MTVMRAISSTRRLRPVLAAVLASALMAVPAVTAAAEEGGDGDGKGKSRSERIDALEAAIEKQRAALESARERRETTAEELDKLREDLASLRAEIDAIEEEIQRAEAGQNDSREASGGGE